ncbi:hypothetical protein MNBD_ACTINO02-2971 [hydrothermal vent metagenome]|uniref:Uncharacterized protein n=1 Tax=hydrothermal vent metagenome TaxID=652676 RepID=A0A3B0RYS4_9ZZZZ
MCSSTYATGTTRTCPGPGVDSVMGGLLFDYVPTAAFSVDETGEGQYPWGSGENDRESTHSGTSCQVCPGSSIIMRSTQSTGPGYRPHWLSAFHLASRCFTHCQAVKCDRRGRYASLRLTRGASGRSGRLRRSRRRYASRHAAPTTSPHAHQPAARRACLGSRRSTQGLTAAQHFVPSQGAC